MNTSIKNDKYIFNPVARTITFIGLSTVLLQSVYAIFNVTDGICIYDFGDPTKTGSISGNVLTLLFDTSAMSATDSLLIKYDDGNILGIDVATKIQDESIPFLRRIVKLLEASANVDVGNRQRINVDSITAGTTLPTVTTVGTVTTVTNAVGVGNVATIAGLGQQQFADTSRICYNTGLRSKLIFS